MMHWTILTAFDIEYHLKQIIEDLLRQAALTLSSDAGSLAIILERPKSAEHGDFATNIAMQLAKPLKQNPRAIAEALIKALPPSEKIAKVEIAGAGFINFFLNASTKQTIVREILQKGAEFGHKRVGNIDYIITAIPIFGEARVIRGNALQARLYRNGEVINLRTSIVVIKLARHIPAIGSQQAA